MVRLRVDHSIVEDDSAEVWPVYESVFGDYSDDTSWRVDVWDKHRARTGFRLSRAYVADVLVGFAYGYTGENGQWWTDNARSVLDDLPHERLLLMTSSEPSDPARRLYASEGWQVLGPGVGESTVIMGRRSRAC